MSNESKFINIQRDPCKLPEPEEVIDRVCPTCIPDPSYRSPNWWLQTEPWLNQNTCEYSVVMMVNQNGESYQLSDLRGIFDPPEGASIVISEAGIPTSTPTSGQGQEAVQQASITNAEMFDRIKRSYVKPGIRALLRYYNKVQRQELICARNDCSIFSKSEATKYIRQRVHYANHTSDVSFTEWLQQSDQEIETLPKIDNYNALELFANATEYHFYGAVNNVMAVLVTIPAHIFDQVPNAEAPTLAESVESVRFKTSEFITWIDKMESIFPLFAKYQSYFNHTEEGKLYQVGAVVETMKGESEGTEVPYYATFLEGRFEQFKNKLLDFIETEGYTYQTLFGGVFANPGGKTVTEIELMFDKSDPNRPYKLADMIKIKVPRCSDIELVLPPEPDDGGVTNSVTVGSSDIRGIAYRDQTLMGYIAQYDSIKADLDARETPPWLDFLKKYTFPELFVQYPNSFDSQQNTWVGCLTDKFAGLDDYILNETMNFFDAWSYQYNKKNCQLLREASGLPVVPSPELEKMNKSQEQQKLKEPGPFDAFLNVKIEGTAYEKFLQVANPCNWRKTTLKAIQCLLSGMTFEEGFRATAKALLGDVTAEGMEIVLSGLPADKQATIRQSMKEKFSDLPAPWEVGYEAGDTSAAYDAQALKNINQDVAKHKSYGSIYDRLEEIEKLLESYRMREPSYEKYLDKNHDTAKMVQLQEATARALSNVNTKQASVDLQIADKNAAYDELQDAINFFQSLAENPTAPVSGLSVASDMQTAAWQKYNEENEKLKILQQQLQVLLTKYDAALAAEQGIKPDSQEFYYQQMEKRRLDLIEEQKTLLAQKEKLLNEIDAGIERNALTVGFSDLPPEEQEKVIEAEKQKMNFIAGADPDKIKQGTYGRAVGSFQKEVMAAYVDVILENATIEEISQGLNALPGAKVFNQIFAGFDCPGYTFFTPRLDEFLGTFTLGGCADGDTKPFILPKLKKLPELWDWFVLVGESFVDALANTCKRVVAALIYKVLQTLEAALCKSLAFVGQGIKDLASASNNNWRFPRSFPELLDDIVCGDQLSEEDQEKAKENLFSLSGASAPGAISTASDVLETMATLGSEQEYLSAMTGNGDTSFLNNVSRTLSVIHPEWESLGNPQSLESVLVAAGNQLTAEQREYAEELSQTPAQLFPLNPSICLSNEEAEQYYNQLTDVFEQQIGDPDIAREFVNKQKRNLADDLTEIAQILVEGPEGALQKEIDKLFAPPDPDCVLDPSLLKDTEEVKELKAEIIEGMFAGLQKAYLDDTIQQNSFEFTDPVGVLLRITSDVVGYNYGFHFSLRNNWFLKALVWLGVFDGEAPFPETVGLYLRDQIISNVPSYDERASFRLEYNNNLEESDQFRSRISIVESYPTFGEDLNRYNNSNFMYQTIISTAEGETALSAKNNFIVEPYMTEEEKLFIDQYAPSQDELSFSVNDRSNNFRNYVLKNYIEKILKDKIGNINLDIEGCHVITKMINQFMFQQFKETLVSDQNGLMAESFKHGGINNTITLDDLTYVDPTPGATEYTYTDEAKVLGRSFTDNPRVKFLDPKVHGGTYTLPNIYIEPATNVGWIGFSKTLVPNFDGCDRGTSNFLGLKQLEDKIAVTQQKIPFDERLEEGPECVVEVPFAKIGSPATLATLEACVSATIRIYITEFLVNSYPIHGNLAFNDKNFDELLMEYISEKMQEGLSEQTSFFAFNIFGTYEGYAYWLLFLEQCAQTYNRKIINGELESDIEADEMSMAINEAQISYTKPKRDDLAELDINVFLEVGKNKPANIFDLINSFTEQVGRDMAYMFAGGILMRKNNRDWMEDFSDIPITGYEEDKATQRIIYPGAELPFLSPFFTQNRMNFMAKIAYIAEYEENCKVFLKRLIREEIKYFSDKIASDASQRPLIYDINKYFIGGSNILHGKNIRAGLYDVEVPIGGASGLIPTEIESPEYYGTINHCAKSDGFHPLESADLSYFDWIDIKGYGGFYLEKYLRIIPKGAPLSDEEMALMDYRESGTLDFNKRESEINPSNAASKELPSGVQNITEFIEFLKTQEITEDTNISDLFGNAQLSFADKGYVGSTGIKFGVRLCYIPAGNFDISQTFDTEQIKEIKTNSLKEKTWLFNENDTLEQNQRYQTWGKYTIPLVSYEQDILDEKLVSFKEANEDFNQDLKCYIDGLVSTDEFKMIFDRVFNLKKVGSIFSIYSDVNFLTSLGLGENERREPELGGVFNLLDGEITPPDSDERSKTFNDSKHVCRKLFVSNYNRKDFDPPDEEDDVDELSLLTQSLLAKTFNALSLDSAIPWLTQKRIRKNLQTNVDGSPCENQFGGMFDFTYDGDGLQIAKADDKPDLDPDPDPTIPKGTAEVPPPEEPTGDPDLPEDQSPGGSGDSGFSGEY